MPSVNIVLGCNESNLLGWTDSLVFSESITIKAHLTVHFIHPLLWDIGNVDVVVDGLTEVVERLSKLVSLWGVLELLESTVEGMGLLVFESIMESIIEVGVPVGVLKVLVVLLDIINSILESVHLGVVDMNTSWGLLDGFVESLSELLPLFHEGLTFGGSLELLIKGLKLLDLIRSSPIHGVFTNVLDDWRVLN